MAAVLRTSIARLVSGKAIAPKLTSGQVQQTCGISSKAIRDLNGIKRPPPYDYKNKTYGLFASFFDKTTHRIDENSKV